VAPAETILVVIMHITQKQNGFKIKSNRCEYNESYEAHLMRRGAEERLMCCCLVRARVYSAGGRGRGGDSVEHVYKRDPHKFAKEYRGKHSFCAILKLIYLKKKNF